MNKAAFLDRDGVINRRAPKGEYITRWEDMRFLPGVAEAIGLLNRSGFWVIVVSNQRGVARGLMTLQDLESLHSKMCEALAQEGARIDAIYYCPHEKQPPCACRKPAPGMLLAAAKDHQIDVAASWMVGDSDIDIQAGKSAGCRTARLLYTGETEGAESDLVVSSLIEAAREILQHDKIATAKAPATWR